MLLLVGPAKWFYATTAILGSLLCVVNPAKPHRVVGQEAQSPSPTRESLEAASNAFLVALRSRDAEALLGQFSRKGVVFGVDSDRISWAVVKKRMQKNGELYCLFFSTECLRRNPDFRKQDAIRDVLLAGKSSSVQVAIQKDPSRTIGEVRFFVHGNPNRAQNGDQFCDLTFIFVDQSWKIVEVQYY